MNPNNQTIPDDEIDLKEIILTLWKEKILIFVITLLFTFLGFFYQAFKPKVYQTSATIRFTSYAVFEEFLPFMTIKNLDIMSSTYNNEFRRNLLSTIQAVRFVEKNEKLNNLKAQLKKKNIDLNDYFKNRIKEEKKKKDKTKIHLTFIQPLDAQEFLDDYIIYTKKNTESKIKDQIANIISNQIKIYNQNLDIAKKINLMSPFAKSLDQSKFTVTSPYELFYRGTKVLTLQILYLEQLLDQSKNLTLNYDPILLESSKPELTLTSPTKFVTISIALILGLFISIITVFIRIILSR